MEKRLRENILKGKVIQNSKTIGNPTISQVSATAHFHTVTVLKTLFKNFSKIAQLSKVEYQMGRILLNLRNKVSSKLKESGIWILALIMFQNNTWFTGCKCWAQGFEYACSRSNLRQIFQLSSGNPYPFNTSTFVYLHLIRRNQYQN